MQFLNPAFKVHLLLGLLELPHLLQMLELFREGLALAGRFCQSLFVLKFFDVGLVILPFNLLIEFDIFCFDYADGLLMLQFELIELLLSFLLNCQFMLLPFHLEVAL
jgi:hypothetical protein